MSLSFNIALRYLRAKKGHTAVNIISIISVLGVVVTTAALICVLSVFNGFHDLIKEKLSTVDPDIAITATMGKTIADADSVVRVAQAIPGVEMAMPVVEDNALAIFADYSMPLRLKGVPKDYNRLTGIDSVIVEGDFLLEDEVSRYAVLGVGPAVSLNARAGSLRMLQLYAPQRRGQVDLNDPMNAFTEDSVFVAGIFMVQQKDFDNDMIFAPIDLARELFDYTTEATQVELKLARGASEQAVMDQLNAQLGESYTVKNRMMQQDASFRLVNMEKWITFLLLAFILVIATFNVISTLSLLIIEKDESIRTFRSLRCHRQANHTHFRYRRVADCPCRCCGWRGFGTGALPLPAAVWLAQALGSPRCGDSERLSGGGGLDRCAGGVYAGGGCWACHFARHFADDAPPT